MKVIKFLKKLFTWSNTESTSQQPEDISREEWLEKHGYDKISHCLVCGEHMGAPLDIYDTCPCCKHTMGYVFPDQRVEFIKECRQDWLDKGASRGYDDKTEWNLDKAREQIKRNVHPDFL